MNCFPPSVRVLPEAHEGPPAYAAKELIRYLAKAGIAARDDPGAYPIHLRSGLPGLPYGAFRCEAATDGLWIRSGEPCGLVYGVYALLEKLGFRFFAPDCEAIPRPPLPLPEPWEEHPAFRVREVFWRSALDGAYAVKLRLNTARASITPEQGGKAMFYNFSHTFSQLVPPEDYFDAHPEYFSMRDGKRLREKTQLCLTNPDVLRLCAEGVLKWKREHPAYTVFSVSMNDWYNNCQCPACRKIDEEEESGAGTMLRFVNAVARAVTHVYPDVRIHTFAYLYCRKPPRLTKPHPAVILRLCAIECCYSHPMAQCGCEMGPVDVQAASTRRFRGDPRGESAFMRDLKGWSALCREQLFVWDYTTNYANYLQPFPNLDVLKENLNTFRRRGVVGVLEQGNFSLGRAAALGDLKVYLLGKLLWDPDQDVPVLIREFAQAYWEKAAPAMLNYIELWQRAARDCHMGIYDAPDAPYLTEQTLCEAEACLARALALAEGAARERVEREALSVRYVRLAREDPDAPGHGERVDLFGADARRLGITELFERRDLEGSLECLRKSRFTRDRACARPIRYPI